MSRPVFPSFSFRHSSVFVGTHAGIKEPRDLIGKRMGVPKYHMTAAVWIRGMLEDDYGVAPKDMRWFEGGGEGSLVKEVDVTLPPDVPHQCGLHLQAGARAAPAQRRRDVFRVDAGDLSR